MGELRHQHTGSQIHNVLTVIYLLFFFSPSDISIQMHRQHTPVTDLDIGTVTTHLWQHHNYTHTRDCIKVNFRK